MLRLSPEQTRFLTKVGLSVRPTKVVSPFLFFGEGPFQALARKAFKLKAPSTVARKPSVSLKKTPLQRKLERETAQASFR